MKPIVIKPVVSEKSITFTPDGKYVFEVANKSNKHEITAVIEKIYKVKIQSVNTIRVQGKKKRYRGRPSGQTKNWKKAIITLVKGQKIADFEVKK